MVLSARAHTMSPPPHTHTHTLFPFPPGCHCYWSGVQRDAGEARVWTATTCATSQCSLHARSPVHGPFTPSPWPPTAARMTPPTLIWVAVGGRGGERGGEGHGTPVQAGCACLSSAAALLLLFSPLPCMLHCLFPTAAPPPPRIHFACVFVSHPQGILDFFESRRRCVYLVRAPSAPHPPLPQLSPPPRTHTPQYRFQHA